MSELRQEAVSEKKPSTPAHPFAPFPNSVRWPGLPEPGAVGAASPNPQAHFEEIYNNHLRRRQEVWARLREAIGEAYRRYRETLDEVARSSQVHCEEAHRAYARAAHSPGSAAEAERCAEQAYRDYMKAVREEWAAEEARQGSEEAHRNYVGKLEGLPESGAAARLLDEAQHDYEGELQRTLQPEVAARCCAAYDEYARALREARESCQSGCAEAYRQYVHELHEAWRAADVKALDAPLLSAIGQSIVAVAFYASEGSAACG